MTQNIVQYACSNDRLPHTWLSSNHTMVPCTVGMMTCLCYVKPKKDITRVTCQWYYAVTVTLLWLRDASAADASQNAPRRKVFVQIKNAWEKRNIQNENFIIKAQGYKRKYTD